MAVEALQISNLVSHKGRPQHGPGIVPRLSIAREDALRSQQREHRVQSRSRDGKVVNVGEDSLDVLRVLGVDGPVSECDTPMGVAIFLKPPLEVVDDRVLLEGADDGNKEVEAEERILVRIARGTEAAFGTGTEVVPETLDEADLEDHGADSQ